MTEKEAIEALKEHKQLLNKKYLKSRWETAIGTVLQALEQKDKKIAELKEKYDKDTHTLQNQLDLANADRVEKYKIIKLMAKYINSTDKDEDVCRETGDTFNCTEYRNCEECIINFFKKKASEENEKNNSI